MKRKLKEYDKEQKFKDVAEKTIKAIVSAKMTGSGYKWYFESSYNKCVLYVKMKRGKMIKI